MSRYARFFPPELSAPAERETWPWQGLEVSVSRRPVADAPLTCIVLHGGGGNSELLAPILAALAGAGFDSLAPDLPGYGRTVAPAREVRYPTWVRLVRDLARGEAARTSRPIAVFGLSMGGMLGYHAAAETPEIAGVAATNLLDTRDPKVRAGVARIPALGRLVGLLVPALDPVSVPIRWLSKMSQVANDPQLAEACASDPRGGGSRVPLGFLRTWMSYAPATEPERFDRPVLLAHPGEDRWTPTKLSQRFFDRLGGPKRLVVLENCGHAPIEEPGLSTLREELRGFLAELAAGANAAPAVHSA